MSIQDSPHRPDVVKPEPKGPRHNCEGADPDLFFPINKAESAPAREYCEMCPALAECRKGAIERGERYGVWAGLYLRDRTVLAEEARIRERKEAKAMSARQVPVPRRKRKT